MIRLTEQIRDLRPRCSAASQRFVRLLVDIHSRLRKVRCLSNVNLRWSFHMSWMHTFAVVEVCHKLSGTQTGPPGHRATDSDQSVFAQFN